MKTTLKVILSITALTLFVCADEVVKGDGFTQDDLKVAVLLKELHDYYVAQDRKAAELLAAKQDPRDAQLDFGYQISTREAEIDKRVGCEKMVELLGGELEKIKAEGLGVKHPHTLWFERLIAGLKQRIIVKQNKAEMATPRKPSD